MTQHCTAWADSDGGRHPVSFVLLIASAVWKNIRTFQHFARNACATAATVSAVWERRL
jgi:hypothetical protein